MLDIDLVNISNITGYFFRTVIPRTFGIKFYLLSSHVVEIMHAFLASYSAEKNDILKAQGKVVSGSS